MVESDQMLKNGTLLKCNAGDIKILSLIGKGGQGEVYKVELNGELYAFKYFFLDNCKSSFKENLEKNIKNPVGAKQFLWPKYLVENDKQFGYVMDLIPSGFYTLHDWVSGRVDTTIEKLLITCINLCDGFHDLHSLGYSYKDISLANVCFDPLTGDVLILDNDNVTENLGSSGIKGTPQFMAPELVSGMIKTPTRKTDLFSLSVLLFYLLMCDHPLEGNFHNKSEADFDSDEEWSQLIYGYHKARFIFQDEDNLDKYIDLNVPSNVNAKEMWQLYPKKIRDLFRRAFVDGIQNSDLRPQTYEWTDAFVKALGKRYDCPHCGHPMFFNKKEYEMNGRKLHCNECGCKFNLPILIADKSPIIINDGDLLYAGYFQINDDLKMNTVMEAEYKNGRLRLKNVSNHKVCYDNKFIRYGEYGDYLENSHEITINGKTYSIRVPK